MSKQQDALLQANMSKISGSTDAITTWDKVSLQRRKLQSVEMYNNLVQIIDRLGEASAKAQHLPHAITSAAKLSITDNILYLYSLGNKPVGILKVGKKKLFYMNQSAAFCELEPLCVLDFYVSESCQRQGVGKQLFQAMLQVHHVMPNKLAYDRPSPKLLAFLAKHYGLHDYIPQANNFVIFKSYFVDVKREATSQSVTSTKHPAPLIASLPVQDSILQYNPITSNYQEYKSSLATTTATLNNRFSPMHKQRNQWLLNQQHEEAFKTTQKMKPRPF